MCGRVFSRFVSASRTPPGGLPSLSLDVVSTPSARTLSIPVYRRSYLIPSDTAKGLDDQGNVCFVGNCANYPEATTTMDQYGFSVDPDLEKICVLWNNSCTGNVTFARNEFFANTNYALLDNDCFQEQPTEPSEPNGMEDCSKVETQQRLRLFGQAKKWMRSPRCLSDEAVWSSSVPDLALDFNLPKGYQDLEQCCSKCRISAENVDIYYWPEADVDTSCLDIIGNGTNPLNYGATTTSQEWNWLGRSSSTLFFLYLLGLHGSGFEYHDHRLPYANQLHYVQSICVQPMVATNVPSDGPDICHFRCMDRSPC